MASRPRRYRRTSKSYRALIEYIAQFQSKNTVAPTSLRDCGAALGISHSQVKRLLAKAVAGGILKKTGPGALAYELILNPPTEAGVVWIPLSECNWTKPIKWTSDPAQGVWLDRAVYGIEDETGLVALTFPEVATAGEGRRLGLNEHALALVQRVRKEDVRTKSWYVVECGRRVWIAGFVGAKRVNVSKRKGVPKWVEEWTFRTGVRGETDFVEHVTEITHLAKILMITRRPPPLPAPTLRRRRKATGSP